MNMDPIAANMFVFYFGIVADITPPVALAAYAGSAIAKADPMKTGFNATKPVSYTHLDVYKRQVEEVGINFDVVKAEAKKAFGNDDIFMEKFLVEPKHIEVQILADKHGNV